MNCFRKSLEGYRVFCSASCRDVFPHIHLLVSVGQHVSSLRHDYGKNELNRFSAIIHELMRARINTTITGIIYLATSRVNSEQERNDNTNDSYCIYIRINVVSSYERSLQVFGANSSNGFERDTLLADKTNGFFIHSSFRFVYSSEVRAATSRRSHTNSYSSRSLSAR